MTTDFLYSLIITFQIKVEHLDTFIEATRANAHGTRTTEPGNIRFDFFQDGADPTRFTLVEVYRDEAANQAHRQTPHFKAWWAATEHMFTGERFLTPVAALSLE